MSEPGLRKKTPEDFERKKQLWNEVLKDNRGNIGGTVKKGTPQYEAMITKYKALLKKQTTGIGMLSGQNSTRLAKRCEKR